MEIRTEVQGFDTQADTLVVGVCEGEKAEEGFLQELDARSGGILKEVIASNELRGKPGEMVYLHKPGQLRARRLLLVGMGKREGLSFDSISKFAGSAARFLRGKN